MADIPEPAVAANSTAVERRIISVVFADLVGFTPLSERLDAEDVSAIQDAYFASVRETAERYGGVVEKFIGDAAMAVFGAPRTRDDDAERAVRAGLAMVAGVEQLGARLGLEPGELQLRVGVNTGEVVYATAGPDTGRVTGDAVNTAARLQTAAEPNRVLVGELTALAVREAIELEAMGPIALKGKADPVRAWQANAVRAEPSRDAALGELRAPIVGRDDELARLEALRGGRITIIAPPGVGKSRLVAELAERMTAHGARVLRTRARPQAAGPYEAVGQLLAAAGAPEALVPALERAGLSRARRDVIASEVAALLRPAPATAASVSDLAAERDAQFAAAEEALDALVAPDPALWIVEDVHWAGGDLLAFLEHAATERRRIVCTARQSLLETDRQWVEAADRMELATLPAIEASALVHGLVGSALPEALVEGIAERSDGNPLFIEELLRTWISVGTLVRDDDAWRLAVDPGALRLPATVQAIYSAQLDDLPADARLVARRASVAGRRFADAALGPLELEDHRGGLETLRRRAFVAGPQPDPAGDVYAYRHALLRDAGYASLARAERSRLHTALARWLQESAGERSEEVAQLIAEHYADALASLPAFGDQGRDELAAAAAGWFERAAETALAMAAPTEAIRLLDRSIGLSQEDAIDLARRRLRRGTVLADSADLATGIADLSAALELLSDRLPAEHTLYATAVYTLALAYMEQIRFQEAESLTSIGLRRLAEADEPAGLARLMALHAWSVAAQGRDDGAADEARLAREMGATLENQAAQLDILEHFAATSDELDMPDASVWEELEERALDLGRWRQSAIASRIRALLVADDDPRAALGRLDTTFELAQAHGLTEQQGWIDLSRAETLFVTGDWDAALEAGDRAIALGERNSYERLTFRTWMVVLPILAARRDASWTHRHQAWWGGISELPLTASPYGVTLRAATQLWLAGTRGEVFKGPIELPDALPPFSNPHFLAAREVIAETLLAAGEVERAAFVAGEAPDRNSTPLMRSSEALMSGWVAAARGDGSATLAAAAAAADHARSIGAVWWVMRALRLAGPSPEADALQRTLGKGSPPA